MKKIIILIIILLPFTAFATDNINNNIINEQINRLNLNELENKSDVKMDISKTASDIATGNFSFNFKDMANSVFALLFNETKEQFSIMQQIIIISILSALLKNLSESFSNTAVSELGFYACYISLVIVIFSFFNVSVKMTASIVDMVYEFMMVSIPIFISFFAMSGHIVTNITMSPLLIAGIGIIMSIIKTVILPLIALGAVVNIINHMSQKNLLDNLSNLFKKGLSMMLKLVSLGFMSIISFQAIAAPAIDNVIKSSAKLAVSSVPVVGNVLNSSVDTVYSMVGLVKSGTSLAVILFAVSACLIPIVKLIVATIIYKIVAAAIEPICEERIVSCIDSAGDFTILLLGVVLLTLIMFIFMVLVVLFITKI